MTKRAAGVRAGDLEIYYDRDRVHQRRRQIPLTPTEFEILSFLARNHDGVPAHRATSRKSGARTRSTTRALWTLVAQPAKKLEPDPSHPQYLLSEPWVGYRFSTGESSSGTF